jgi:hypothetical protein
MEKLKEYFNAHVGKVFEDIKKSTFIHLGVEINKLIGEIEYITTVSTGNSLFEILTRNIRFEIIKKKNTYIVSMLLEQENDYNIVYGVINTILSEDKHINFNIIEQNLSVLGNTGKIHTFFKESITEINSIYEFIGIINFSRKKADDGSTKDPFEMNLLDGNLETKLTNIEPLIKSLENRTVLDLAELELFFMIGIWIIYLW